MGEVKRRNRGHAAPAGKPSAEIDLVFFERLVRDEVDREVDKVMHDKPATGRAARPAG